MNLPSPSAVVKAAIHRRSAGRHGRRTSWGAISGTHLSSHMRRDVGPRLLAAWRTGVESEIGHSAAELIRHDCSSLKDRLIGRRVVDEGGEARSQRLSSETL